MKIKYLLIFILLLLNTNIVYATERYPVTLNKCVDGDTAYFNYNNEVIKTRFLAIDTPESTNIIEDYGKEASNYTCNLLNNAKTIEIEYEENSDKVDKYNRELVYVWVDGVLIEELLLKEGLAGIAYIYGNYKYTDYLTEIENTAKQNKLNIWSNQSSNIEYNYIILIILTIITILFLIFIYRYKKKAS